MKKAPTTTLFKEIKLTPDLVYVIESRLMSALQPFRDPMWRIYDLNINFSEGFGKVRLKITTPVGLLRKIFSDTYSRPGETENIALKKLMRSDQFQCKRKLYYLLLGKVNRGMTEIEANIMFELSKDEEIQHYLTLRLGKGGENDKTKR